MIPTYNWLDVPVSINYMHKLNVTVLAGERSEVYCFTPISELAGRRQLRSASRQHLIVPPRYRLSTFGRLRAFSVASHTSWNSLPDRLRDPTLSSDSFRRNYLKRGIICELLNILSAVETLRDSALYKLNFTIDWRWHWRQARSPTKRWPPCPRKNNFNCFVPLPAPYTWSILTTVLYNIQALLSRSCDETGQSIFLSRLYTAGYIPWGIVWTGVYSGLARRDFKTILFISWIGSG